MQLGDSWDVDFELWGPEAAPLSRAASPAISSSDTLFPSSSPCRSHSSCRGARNPSPLRLPTRASRRLRRRAPSSTSGSDEDFHPSPSQSEPNSPVPKAPKSKFFVGVAGRSRRGCLLLGADQEGIRPPFEADAHWIRGRYSIAGKVCVCLSRG